jgi:hypothetical protein
MPTVIHQLMRVHAGEKAHSCTLCGKSFAWSNLLNQHMSVHIGENHMVAHCVTNLLLEETSSLLILEIFTQEKLLMINLSC